MITSYYDQSGVYVGAVDLPDGCGLTPSAPVDCVAHAGADLVFLKQKKWTEIKTARVTAENVGFLWDGSIFDSDQASQHRIAAAATLSLINPDFATVWTLKNNTTRTLSGADIRAVGVALGAHISAQFMRGQNLRAQIDGATNPIELDAINWTTL